MENVTDIAFFMVCKQVNFKITHIRSLVSFFVAVSVRQERARHAIWQFRDMGRPFEVYNALTCSWSVLRFPILPVVWFQYYCELKDFVWTSEGDSTLYIQGTAYALWPYFMNIYAWRGAGLARWWERSPPTNVAPVWFPDPASYVGWVCCWFSTLLREIFLRVLRVSPLLKNQHFQIPIRSWNARTFHEWVLVNSLVLRW